MNKSKTNEPKRRFINYPYLMFSSIIIMIITIVAASIMTIDLIIPDPGEIVDYHSGDFIAKLIIFNICWIVLAIVFYINRFEFYSIIHIEDEYIEFSALFSRRKMYYKDLKYIGIDYGIQDLGKRFSIYYSYVPIPMKYHHNMSRMKFTKETMKSYYSKNLYDSLVYYLPPDMSKNFSRHYSVIRNSNVKNK